MALYRESAPRNGAGSSRAGWRQAEPEATTGGSGAPGAWSPAAEGGPRESALYCGV